MVKFIARKDRSSKSDNSDLCDNDKSEYSNKHIIREDSFKDIDFIMNFSGVDKVEYLK